MTMQVVSLRPLRLADLDEIYRWSQDANLNALTGAWPVPPSRAELRTLLEGWLVDPTFRAFTIRLDDRTIGNCWLGHIDGTSATVGILIGEHDAQDHGHGTAAMRLLLAEGQGLMRATLWVYADNARALAVYRKVGFVETGRAENAGRPTITMEASSQPGKNVGPG